MVSGGIEQIIIAEKQAESRIESEITEGERRIKEVQQNAASQIEKRRYEGEVIAREMVSQSESAMAQKIKKIHADADLLCTRTRDSGSLRIPEAVHYVIEQVIGEH